MREEVGMTQPVIGEQGQMAQLSSSTSGIAIHSALFIRKKCAYNMQLPKEGLYILFCNNRYFWISVPHQSWKDLWVKKGPPSLPRTKNAKMSYNVLPINLFKFCSPVISAKCSLRCSDSSTTISLLSKNYANRRFLAKECGHDLMVVLS